MFTILKESCTGHEWSRLFLWSEARLWHFTPNLLWYWQHPLLVAFGNLFLLWCQILRDRLVIPYHFGVNIFSRLVRDIIVDKNVFRHLSDAFSIKPADLAGFCSWLVNLNRPNFHLSRKIISRNFVWHSLTIKIKLCVAFRYRGKLADFRKRLTYFNPKYLINIEHCVIWKRDCRCWIWKIEIYRSFLRT